MNIRSSLSKLIQVADLVIWDEALMMHKNVFEEVDQTFKDLLKFKTRSASTRSFGGKTIMLEDNFRQILLVVKKKGQETYCIYIFTKI